jgi:hypothetical protein
MSDPEARGRGANVMSDRRRGANVMSDPALPLVPQYARVTCTVAIRYGVWYVYVCKMCV